MNYFNFNKPRSLMCLTLILLTWLQLPAQSHQCVALSDTIDVVHYGIHLDVTDFTNHTLKGIAEIDFTTPLPLVSQLGLNLRQLTVDSVKTAEGDYLSFSHSGDYLQIILQQSVTSGDTAKIWIYYHGIPFSESWGGFHFSGNYAFNLGVGFQSVPHNLGKAWFPCVDDFVDRAFYDYYIRVENGKLAACGGLLQSVSTRCDGTKEFHWKSDRSLPTYLASVAVGPYALVEDAFEGLTDTIPIMYFVRQQDTAKVAGSFEHMKQIAGIYENCFGPYPFQRIGITGTAIGAMEHAENIAYPHSSINGSLSDEWLYAHELAHMWFGNMVTCASDADMWLNEGWASWSESLMREKLYDIETARGPFRNMMQEVLRYAHISEGGYLPLSPMPSNHTYGTHIYDKGAMVVHGLRGYLGDSLFFNGIKAYLSQFAYQPANSYQLRDFLTVYTGIDLASFFDFHVFGPGYNHISVDSFNITPVAGLFNVEVFLRQKLRGANVPANDCRTQLTFMNSQRDTLTRTALFSGFSGSVNYILPFEPVLVMCDVDERFADATTDNYKIINKVGEYNFANTYFKLNVLSESDTSWIRVTHHWVAPDSLLIPSPGLTLSNNRYWSVEGIYSPDFAGNGIFTYNRSNALDNDLIQNSADSLVLLYRENARQQWRSISFIQTGPWQMGFITVPLLLPGDYTLAIWDEAWVGIKTSGKTPKSQLSITPNPGKGTFDIERNYTGEGVMTLTSPSGAMIQTSRVKSSDKLIKLNASKLQPGHYYVTISSLRQRESATLIILP
jgi:aminopeptidase N